MKLRRFSSIFLVFCLLLTMIPSSLAAPTRDTRRSEVTLSAELQMLVDLAMGAAILRDVNHLEENETPAPALVEGVMALGLFHLILPYDGEDIWSQKAALSTSEIADYYKAIFTTGDYAHAPAEPFSGITWREDGLDFSLDTLSENPVIGAHIYSAAFDGETVTLLCDLYTYFDDFSQSAEVLPEDALTWLCHGEISLHYAPETLFGYTINGFSLSDTYQDGMLYDWATVENTEYEYSFLCPSILGLAEDDPRHMAWQTADGTAMLTVNVMTDDEKQDYDHMLSAFLMTHPNQTVTQERDFSQFYAVGEGIFTLCLVPEELPWAYTLTLTFPAERQAEFTLYAEFIRNSMIAWGISNG